MADVIGVVVEYNPFHNGHLHHLEKAREKVPGAYILGVMSGNWTQRGEPALMNKWARTEAALKAGADIILELPVVFAVQSAEGFARGAVKTLDATGIVNYICFGSEAGELEPLQETARYLEAEPPQFKIELQSALKRGLSYPAALQYSLQAVSLSEKTMPLSPKVLDIIPNPNNILAIEYLKALQKVNSDITPFTIKRRGAGFHDLKAAGDIASATGIRAAISKNDFKMVKKTVPKVSYEIILNEIAEGRAPVFQENFAEIILSLLRRSSADSMAKLPDVSEGMESRLKKAADSPNISNLLKKLKTRRYTRTRLQRILVYLLLSLNKKILNRFNIAGPSYLRVLGFSNRGKELLPLIKAKGLLPIVTRPAAYLKSSLAPQDGKQMILYDILATDIYVMGYPLSNQRYGGDDFRKPVIKYE